MTAPVVRDMNKMSRIGGVTAIHHDGERAVTVYSNAVKLEIGTCILVLEIPTGPVSRTTKGTLLRLIGAWASPTRIAEFVRL